MFLVPADLFVSYSVISNFGFLAHIETGALGSVLFVLSLGAAMPVATLLLHFDPRQRVAWGIILVASSSVLGFLSVAAELIDYGGSGSVGSNNWLLTLGVTSIEIGCLLTFVGGILAIATL